MLKESSLGEFIRARRQSLALTQEELAECVECSPETVRSIEAGRRKPSPRLAKKFAKQLKIPDDEHEDFICWSRGIAIAQWKAETFLAIPDGIEQATAAHHADGQQMTLGNERVHAQGIESKKTGTVLSSISLGWWYIIPLLVTSILIVVLLSTTSAPTSGMWIMDVEPGSEAAEVGFRKGQVLVSLNGQAIQKSQTANEIVARSIGSPMTAVLWENNTEITVTITPQDRFIGVTLCQLDRCPQGKYP